jgi:hypothetical protein
MREEFFFSSVEPFSHCGRFGVEHLRRTQDFSSSSYFSISQLPSMAFSPQLFLVAFITTIASRVARFLFFVQHTKMGKIYGTTALCQPTECQPAKCQPTECQFYNIRPNANRLNAN